MMNHKLFVSQSNVFGGVQKPFAEADYVVFGVPFDATSTYRTGARFGPTAIRQASLNIETYSFRTGIDVEDVMLHDLGDLHVSAVAEKTLERIALVVKDVTDAGKIPAILGGEHTITLGIIRGLREKAEGTAIVSFDAHLDVRDEYMDLKVSHTTFMRRINEQANPARIIEVGTRAVCKEELAYVKKAGITFFTANEIRSKGCQQIAKELKKMLDDHEKVYVSVDMDALDPAFVPAVQNPEPEGIETHALLDILHGVVDERVVGFDVLEVAPDYDQGVSAMQAAKVVFELLCMLEKSHRE
jgi:agmatinase